MWIIAVGVVCLLSLGLVIFSYLIDRKINHYSRPTGNFTQIDGGTIHFQVQGNGPAVILIHGLSGNLHNWHALENALCQHYTVYSVDRPGNGFSSREKGVQASFEQQADMLKQWIEKEAIEKPLLVGHSMGGAIALQFALRYPGFIRGVTLLCPLVAPVKSAPSALRRLYIPSHWLRQLLAHTLALPIGVKNARHSMAIMFAPESPPSNFASRFGGALSLRKQAFIVASEDIVASATSISEQYRRYKDIPVPVSILFGADDKVLDANYQIQQLVSQLPQAQCEQLPRRGHMIPITAVQECVDWILTHDPLLVSE